MTKFFLDTILQLRKTCSTNEKVSILEKAFQSEYGEDFKKLLLITYSPYITFGIKTIPSVNSSEQPLDNIHDKFLSLANSLEHRKLTGNKAKEELSNFLSLCTTDEQLLYTFVLQKNLKCGINTKLINKACPKLIPVHACQLATTIDYEDIKNKKSDLPDSVMLQPKIDGFRCQLFVYPNKRVELFTRSGKPILGYTGIEKEAKKYLKPNYVYDGEIITREALDYLLSSSKEEEPSRKYFQDTMKFVTAKMDNKDGVLNIFDCVPLSDWLNQSTSLTFKERIYTLAKILRKSVTDKCQYLRLVLTLPNEKCPSSKGRDYHFYTTIDCWLKKFVSMGYEGLIIRGTDSTYDWKRSKSLYKLKLFKDIDLPVIKVLEGDGKYKNSLGAVVVDYQGNNVNVGSGFTDEQRKYYWDNPQEILNHIIEIRYQAETENQNHTKSLSFPTFQCVRVDK